VAATTVAAAATQAAELRVADQAIRGLRANVDRLEARVASGQATIAELTAAREALIAELARRDAQYAQEIAVFRAAVQDIASTPEGLAILAERRPGNLRQARTALLELIARRNAAEQRATQVRQAANLRTGATIALDDRSKGEASTEEVIALYAEVTRLDPGVHWDWVELGRLYVDAGNLPQARRAAERAAETAGNDRDRSVALNELGNILVAEGDLDSFVAGRAQATPAATGEEIGDFLDVDFGF
jgi:tetratricopeptide (TPR) repeat protein